MGNKLQKKQYKRPQIIRARNIAVAGPYNCKTKKINSNHRQYRQPQLDWYSSPVKVLGTTHF